MNRPSWDETFIDVAKVVSKRSTCLRRKVGAVLVRDNKILTTGYNGAPKGLPHCNVAGCLREKLKVPSGERHELCRAVHAEANAIIQAALHGVGTQGATMYVTVAPCSMCARMIINAGINKVIFCGDYPDSYTENLFKEADIEFIKYNEGQSGLE